MTAPYKIWAGIYGNATEKKDIGDVEYIRADLHQSAMAHRGATIARLQARLDAEHGCRLGEDCAICDAAMEAANAE